MNKKERTISLEPKELPVSSEYGPRWVYLATEGTICNTQWTYDWKQMRGRWHPQYFFRWNNLDPRRADDDFVYEIESQTSDHTYGRKDRRRCTLFLVAVGILLTAAIAIPLTFHLLSSEEISDEVVGLVSAQLTLVRIHFKEQMLNKSSVEYTVLSQTFQDELTKLFGRSSLKANYKSCRVNSLSQGSVKVQYDMLFDILNRRIPSSDQIKDVLYSVDRDKNDTKLGVLGHLRFRIDSIELKDQKNVNKDELNDTVGEDIIVGVKNAEDTEKKDTSLGKTKDTKDKNDIHSNIKVDLNNTLVEKLPGGNTTQEYGVTTTENITDLHETTQIIHNFEIIQLEKIFRINGTMNTILVSSTDVEKDTGSYKNDPNVFTGLFESTTASNFLNISTDLSELNHNLETSTQNDDVGKKTHSQGMKTEEPPVKNHTLKVTQAKSIKIVGKTENNIDIKDGSTNAPQGRPTEKTSQSIFPIQSSNIHNDSDMQLNTSEMVPDLDPYTYEYFTSTIDYNSTTGVKARTYHQLNTSSFGRPVEMDDSENTTSSSDFSSEDTSIVTAPIKEISLRHTTQVISEAFRDSHISSIKDRNFVDFITTDTHEEDKDNTSPTDIFISYTASASNMQHYISQISTKSIPSLQLENEKHHTTVSPTIEYNRTTTGINLLRDDGRWTPPPSFTINASTTSVFVPNSISASDEILSTTFEPFIDTSTTFEPFTDISSTRFESFIYNESTTFEPKFSTSNTNLPNTVLKPFSHTRNSSSDPSFDAKRTIIEPFMNDGRNETELSPFEISASFEQFTANEKTRETITTATGTTEINLPTDNTRRTNTNKTGKTSKFVLDMRSSTDETFTTSFEPFTDTSDTLEQLTDVSSKNFASLIYNERTALESNASTTNRNMSNTVLRPFLNINISNTDPFSDTKSTIHVPFMSNRSIGVAMQLATDDSKRTPFTNKTSTTSRFVTNASSAADKSFTTTFEPFTATSSTFEPLTGITNTNLASLVLNENLSLEPNVSTASANMSNSVIKSSLNISYTSPDTFSDAERTIPGLFMNDRIIESELSASGISETFERFTDKSNTSVKSLTSKNNTALEADTDTRSTTVIPFSTETSVPFGAFADSKSMTLEPFTIESSTKKPVNSITRTILERFINNNNIMHGPLTGTMSTHKPSVIKSQKTLKERLSIRNTTHEPLASNYTSTNGPVTDTRPTALKIFTSENSPNLRKNTDDESIVLGRSTERSSIIRGLFTGTTSTTTESFANIGNIVFSSFADNGSATYRYFNDSRSEKTKPITIKSRTHLKQWNATKSKGTGLFNFQGRSTLGVFHEILSTTISTTASTSGDKIGSFNDIGKTLTEHSMDTKTTTYEPLTIRSGTDFELLKTVRNGTTNDSADLGQLTDIGSIQFETLTSENSTALSPYTYPKSTTTENFTREDDKTYEYLTNVSSTTAEPSVYKSSSVHKPFTTFENIVNFSSTAAKSLITLNTTNPERFNITEITRLEALTPNSGASFEKAMDTRIETLELFKNKSNSTTGTFGDIDSTRFENITDSFSTAVANQRRGSLIVTEKVTIDPLIMTINDSFESFTSNRSTTLEALTSTHRKRNLTPQPLLSISTLRKTYSNRTDSMKMLTTHSDKTNTAYDYTSSTKGAIRNENVYMSDYLPAFSSGESKPTEDSVSKSSSGNTTNTAETTYISKLSSFPQNIYSISSVTSPTPNKKTISKNRYFLKSTSDVPRMKDIYQPAVHKDSPINYTKNLSTKLLTTTYTPKLLARTKFSTDANDFKMSSPFSTKTTVLPETSDTASNSTDNFYTKPGVHALKGVSKTHFNLTYTTNDSQSSPTYSPKFKVISSSIVNKTLNPYDAVTTGIVTEGVYVSTEENTVIPQEINTLPLSTLQTSYNAYDSNNTLSSEMQNLHLEPGISTTSALTDNNTLHLESNVSRNPDDSQKREGSILKTSLGRHFKDGVYRNTTDTPSYDREMQEDYSSSYKIELEITTDYQKAFESTTENSNSYKLTDSIRAVILGNSEVANTSNASVQKNISDVTINSTSDFAVQDNNNFLIGLSSPKIVDDTQTNAMLGISIPSRPSISTSKDQSESETMGSDTATIYRTPLPIQETVTTPKPLISENYYAKRKFTVFDTIYIDPLPEAITIPTEVLKSGGKDSETTYNNVHAGTLYITPFQTKEHEMLSKNEKYRKHYGFKMENTDTTTPGSVNVESEMDTNTRNDYSKTGLKTNTTVAATTVSVYDDLYMNNDTKYNSLTTSLKTILTGRTTPRSGTVLKQLPDLENTQIPVDTTIPLPHAMTVSPISEKTKLEYLTALSYEQTLSTNQKIERNITTILSNLVNTTEIEMQEATKIVAAISNKPATSVSPVESTKTFSAENVTLIYSTNTKAINTHLQSGVLPTQIYTRKDKIDRDLSFSKPQSFALSNTLDTQTEIKTPTNGMQWLVTNNEKRFVTSLSNLKTILETDGELTTHTFVDSTGKYIPNLSTANKFQTRVRTNGNYGEFTHNKTTASSTVPSEAKKNITTGLNDVWKLGKIDWLVNNEVTFSATSPSFTQMQFTTNEFTIPIVKGRKSSATNMPNVKH